ncbi:MAG: hypothetical protein ACR2QA_16155 [Solirubrobacteraceae bacterium]
MLVIRHDRACARPFSGGPTFSQGAPSAKLLSILGVLRRPATALDHLPARFLAHGDVGASQGIYVRFVRLARVAYGLRFYIAPVASGGELSAHCAAEAESKLRLALPTIPRRQRAGALSQGIALIQSSGPHEGILHIDSATHGRDGGASCCATPAAIEQIGQPGFQSASSRSCIGAASCDGTSILMAVIPDGVASVTYYFPASESSALTRRGLTVTTRPVNNVLAVRVPIGAPFATKIIWRSANGMIIKAINAGRTYGRGSESQAARGRVG